MHRSARIQRANMNVKTQQCYLCGQEENHWKIICMQHVPNIQPCLSLKPSRGEGREVTNDRQRCDKKASGDIPPYFWFYNSQLCRFLWRCFGRITEFKVCTQSNPANKTTLSRVWAERNVHLVCSMEERKQKQQNKTSPHLHILDVFQFHQPCIEKQPLVNNANGLN